MFPPTLIFKRYPLTKTNARGEKYCLNFLYEFSMHIFHSIIRKFTYIITNFILLKIHISFQSNEEILVKNIFYHNPQQILDQKSNMQMYKNGSKRKGGWWMGHCILLTTINLITTTPLSSKTMRVCTWKR